MSVQSPPSVLFRSGAPAARAVAPASGSDSLGGEERTVRELRAELAARRGRQRSAWQDLAGLRGEVWRAVELSSVRRVAVAIGTSHEGLRRFLNGGKPYPATLEKIVRWAERTEPGGVDAQAESSDGLA